MAKRATMQSRIAGESGDQKGAAGLSPADAVRARIQAAGGTAMPAAAPPARPEGRAPMEGAPRVVGAAPAPVERAARRRMTDRQPFGSFEQQLQVPAIPGYSQRWFNDTPGRIERAKRAGWEHVQDEVSRGPMMRNVGRGEGSQRGLSAYLMKTPIEWYSEDQGAQQADLETRLRDIRNGQGQGENQYLGANHKIVQGTTR